MKYCVYCGQSLGDEAKFCSRCGKKVENVNEQNESDATMEDHNDIECEETDAIEDDEEGICADTVVQIFSLNSNGDNNIEITADLDAYNDLRKPFSDLADGVEEAVEAKIFRASRLSVGDLVDRIPQLASEVFKSTVELSINVLCD